MANPMNLRDFLRSGGLESTDRSNDEQLAFIRQYDPNAQWTTMGSGDDQRFQKLQYDSTKLPTQKAGYTPNLKLDDNGNPLKGSGTFTPRTGATNANKIWDANYGWMVPDKDVGEIDEKTNNAQQNKEGGLFSTIGNALVPSDKPWMTIPTVIGAGLGSAGLSALEKGGLQLGMGAITSGGKNLTNPLSYLGLGMNMLPPEVQKILNLAKFGYGAYTNPVGTATGLATGAAGNFVANILKGK